MGHVAGERHSHGVQGEHTQRGGGASGGLEAYIQHVSTMPQVPSPIAQGRLRSIQTWRLTIKQINIHARRRNKNPRAYKTTPAIYVAAQDVVNAVRDAPIPDVDQSTAPGTQYRGRKKCVAGTPPPRQQAASRRLIEHVTMPPLATSREVSCNNIFNHHWLI